MSVKQSSNSARFDIEILNPTDSVNGGIFDPEAPTAIPVGKIDLALKWAIKATGNETTFDLKNLPLVDAIMTKLKGAKTLTNPEIHVVWKSHVPPTSDQDNVTIALLFTQYQGFENQLQTAHVHPTHLHMHHIFYPRNSCALSIGSVLPWAIDIHVEGADYLPSYTVADVYIRLIGYGQAVTSYAEDRESELISLVPLSIPVQGIKMSKPRVGGGTWTVGGFKKGTSSRENAKKLLLLQQLGVNIEGVNMMGLLKKTMAAIPRAAISLNPTADVLLEAGRAVGRILGNNV